MSDNSMVIRQVTAIALAGTSRRTWLSHLLNGKPLSRAKANVWRAVDALNEMLAAMIRMRTRMVNALTPVVLTALLNT